MPAIEAASISRICPISQSGICYSLNIPNSASDDIFLQISAPRSLSWIGLGQGNQMAGSNMFVVYQSANGMDVTVSPRLGTGHLEPGYNEAAGIELLEGSGIFNRTMIANLRCSTCTQWEGGSMDFSASSGKWIHAAKRGKPIRSDHGEESLSQHDFSGTFIWDFKAARGGGSEVSNPFIADSATTTTGIATNIELPTNIRNAHGALACIAIVILFPIGGIIIRLAPFQNSLTPHRIIQTIGWTVFIAAYGLGQNLSSTLQMGGKKHTIIGTVVFVMILLQPVFGWLHHRKFQKTKSHNWWSFAHLGIGRIAIVLGTINGGFGVQLAEAPKGTVVGYSVVAGIFGVGYIASVVWGESKRWEKKKMQERSPMSSGVREQKTGSSTDTI